MNKPVAWLNGNEICPEIGYEATITMQHPKDLGWIPLYTHPVKELTDEEIEECYWGDGYPDNPRCPKDFAKAIEERVRGIK